MVHLIQDSDYSSKALTVMNTVETPLAHPPHGMPLLQPPGKRRFTMTGNPPSPLALKRWRTDSPGPDIFNASLDVTTASINSLPYGPSDSDGNPLYAFQDTPENAAEVQV
jgi:hypothetical protein